MFTLIVPVYNAIDYLGQCLDSLLAQAYHDFEVILIDDGSVDGRGGLCDQYAAQDSRFRVLHQANQGVSVARNAGLSQATQEFILFVDADDWLSPQALTALAKAVERYPEADFWQFGYGENDFPDFESGAQSEPQGSGQFFDSIAAYACEQSCCMVWLMVFRRSLIEREALRFPAGIRCAEDQAFILQYQMLSRSAVCLPQPLYHYRIHHDSAMGRTLTQERLRSYVEDHFQVVKLLLQFCQERRIRLEAWMAVRLQQLVKAALQLLAKHRPDRETCTQATAWVRTAWQWSDALGDTSFLTDRWLRLARIHAGLYVLAVRLYWRRRQAWRQRSPATSCVTQGKTCRS